MRNIYRRTTRAMLKFKTYLLSQNCTLYVWAQSEEQEFGLTSFRCRRTHIFCMNKGTNTRLPVPFKKGKYNALRKISEAIILQIMQDNLLMKHTNASFYYHMVYSFCALFYHVVFSYDDNYMNRGIFLKAAPLTVYVCNDYGRHGGNSSSN